MIRFGFLVVLLLFPTPTIAQEDPLGDILQSAILAIIDHANELADFHGRSGDVKTVWLDQVTFHEKLGTDETVALATRSTTRDEPRREVSDRDTVIDCEAATEEKPGVCRVKDEGMFVELVRVQAGGVDEAIVYLTYHVPTPSLHRAPMCPSRMKVTLKLEEKAATGGEIWVVKKLEQYNAC